MSKIVNLRQARKQRIRSEAKAAADANAAKHGRSKANKEQTEAATSLEQRRLDGHKRDDD